MAAFLSAKVSDLYIWLKTHTWERLISKTLCCDSNKKMIEKQQTYTGTVTNPKVIMIERVKRLQCVCTFMYVQSWNEN